MPAKRILSKKIFVAAVCCLLAVCLAWSAQAQDEMTLEQVLEKHAEARGGDEAFAAIDTARVNARMTMGPGMEAPVTVVSKAPNKVRMDIEFQGQAITQVWDGEKGWQIMPIMGNPDPQEMSDDEAKQVKRQDLIRGLLLTYEERGYTAKYLGIREIEGTEAHAVEITMEDGDTMISYLDTEYFMVFMQKTEGISPQTSQPIKSNISYGDFKEVAGVLMPYSIEVATEGAPSIVAITIETIEVNTGDIGDDLFTMPEVEAPAEAEGDGDSGQG